MASAGRRHYQRHSGGQWFGRSITLVVVTPAGVVGTVATVVAGGRVGIGVVGGRVAIGVEMIVPGNVAIGVEIGSVSSFLNMCSLTGWR